MYFLARKGIYRRNTDNTTVRGIINMSYIFVSVLSILIWQIFSFILCFIIKDDLEEKAFIFAICVPYFLWRCLIKTIRFLVLSWCKKYLHKYNLCYKSHNFKGKIIKRPFYATPKVVKHFTQDNSKDFYIEYVSNGSNIKYIPDTRYSRYCGQKFFREFDMELFKMDKYKTKGE